MGLCNSLHLAERGYKVTLLEKQSDVAKVASYINGAMICPSMTASWASLKLLSQVCSIPHRLGVRPILLVFFIVAHKMRLFDFTRFFFRIGVKSKEFNCLGTPSRITSSGDGECGLHSIVFSLAK